jgi:hypothetical protein
MVERLGWTKSKETLRMLVMVIGSLWRDPMSPAVEKKSIRRMYQARTVSRPTSASKY